MPPKTATSPGQKAKIRKSDIFRVFLRSFFLQSVWNYRSLISIGFGMCLVPIMRRLYGDAASQSAFLERHFKFFNAHPYMASYALGVSIHLEEAFAAGETEACEKLDKFKTRLAGVLGAVGDKLFWSTIKPAALTFGVAGLILIPGTLYKFLWLTAAFAVYNVPHIYMRYRGILQGYEQGVMVYKQLNEKRYAPLHRRYYWLGIVSLAAVGAGLLWQLTAQGLAATAIFLMSGLLTVLLFRSTRNFYLTVGLVFFLAVGASLFV